MVEANELQLLAALLGTPTDESLALLREVAAAHRWLQPAVEELEQLPLDQWQAQHTALFINGYPTTPCLPFASPWRNGIMHGPLLEDLNDLLARIGVASEQVPPDYLGVLLECAALLQMEPSEKSSDLQRELWDQQLQPWLPRFAAALRQHSPLLLYRTLGTRLEALCDESR